MVKCPTVFCWLSNGYFCLKLNSCFIIFHKILPLRQVRRLENRKLMLCIGHNWASFINQFTNEQVWAKRCIMFFNKNKNASYAHTSYYPKVLPARRFDNDRPSTHNEYCVVVFFTRWYHQIRGKYKVSRQFIYNLRNKFKNFGEERFGGAVVVDPSVAKRKRLEHILMLRIETKDSIEGSAQCLNGWMYRTVPLAL